MRIALFSYINYIDTENIIYDIIKLSIFRGETMFLKRITVALAMALLLVLNATAFAEEFYMGTEIPGYKKGNFALLTGDDVNFRKAPEGEILRTLPRHSLFKVLGESGKWLKVDWYGEEGFVLKEFTNINPPTETLVAEDEIVGDVHVNSVFDFTGIKEELGDKFEKTTKRNITTYTFEKVRVLVDEKTKKLISIESTLDTLYTMRGVGVGDLAPRVLGQYGMPARITYPKDPTKESFIYGYNFGGQEKSKDGLDFYVNHDCAVTKIIVTYEEKK